MFYFCIKLNKMIIGVINTKGGSAKTTTSTNLATCFANRKYQVVLLDCDGGQESSKNWAENRPADKPLVRVEVVAPQYLATTAKALEKEGYLVIIDSAPKQSELANLIIVASDIILIPIQPSFYDFRGFENFLSTFRMFQDAKHANGGVVKPVIVLTRVKQKTVMLDSIKLALANYEIPLLKSEIVEREAYKITAGMGIGVVEYSDPKAKFEIDNLTSEIERIFDSF